MFYFSTVEDEVEMAAETSSLIEHYRKEKGERAEARLENLNEVVTAARRL